MNRLLRAASAALIALVLGVAGLVLAGPANAEDFDLTLSAPSDLEIAPGGAADLVLTIGGMPSAGESATLTVTGTGDPAVSLQVLSVMGSDGVDYSADCPNIDDLTIECTLSNLPATELALTFKLKAADFGMTGNLGITATLASGTDTNPSNNEANVALTVPNPVADLTFGLSDDAISVAVGESTTITAWVRNDGPDAVATAGAVFALFDGAGVALSFSSPDVAAGDPLEDGSPSWEWSIGELASGATVELSITITGTAVGDGAVLGFVAVAPYTTDPTDCVERSPLIEDCGAAASITVTDPVSAMAVSTDDGAVIVAVTASAQLAATGSSNTKPLALVGLLSVLLGLGAVLASRRRS